MSEPLRDIESSDSTGEKDNKTNEYFWKRPKLYIDEWRTCFFPIPIWRLITTIGLIYTFVYCCDFISTLCTQGSKFICATSLLAASAYMLWAIWWDVSYAVPPTWTFIKNQNFNPAWCIVWVTYNTVLVGVAFFICVTTLIINYANLRELFAWECWP